MTPDFLCMLKSGLVFKPFYFRRLYINTDYYLFENPNPETTKLIIFLMLLQDTSV